MIKVLHYPLIDKCRGIETYLTEHLRYLDHSRFQWDFVTWNPAIFMEPFFVEAGSAVYYLSQRKRESERFAQEIAHILELGNYDVLHLHLRIWSEHDLTVLETARRCGVKRIILHAHSMGGSPEQEKFHRKLLRQLADGTDLTLCAGDIRSGRWMFGPLAKNHSITILRNAIDTKRFSPTARDLLVFQKLIPYLNYPEGAFPILSIGYTEQVQYRQDFAIQVAKSFGDHPKPFLRIIGDGPEWISLCLANQENNEWCKVASSVWQVPQLLLHHRCLLAPYAFGGMSRIVLEAQSCGIPCFVSDALPRELDQTGLVHFLSLNKPAAEWAKTIRRVCLDAPPDPTQVRPLEACWDVREAVKRLEGLYEKGEGTANVSQ